AAALVGPAQPYRPKPTVLRFASARDGSASSPDNIARLLRRLDDARISGTLTLTGSVKTAAREELEVTPLAESWERALTGRRPDWSDLLCELGLLSTDYIEPAAVLCIQMNPRRDGTRAAMRFRAARRAGYGVSPQ